jgi:hypothetical protein
MVQVVPPLEGQATTTRVTTAAIVASMKESAAEALPIPATDRIDQLAADAVALVSDPPLERSPPPLPEPSSVAPLAGVARSTGFSGVPWALIAGGLVAAAIVAAGTGWYFFNPDAAPNAAEAKPVAAETGEPDVAPDSNADAREPDDGRPELAAAEPKSAIEESRDDPTLYESSESVEPAPTEPSSENLTANESAAVDGAVSQPSEMADAGADIKKQPTNFDKPSVRQSDAPQESGPPTSDERLARKPSLVLEDLPQSLLQATNPAEVQSTGTGAANERLDLAEQGDPQEQALPDVLPQAAEVPLRRIAPAKVDVPARLATKIAGVEFREAPLYKALETISDLAGVAISLDVEALYASGIGIGEPVNVTGTSLTVGAVLEQALGPVGLRAREEQGQLLVSPLNARQPRKARYAVDDLVRAGDPPIEELVGMIRALVGVRAGLDDMPLDVSVSDGAIVVSAAEIEHDRMVELCEKLRVARGRPLRSRFSADRPDLRFDPRRFELAPRRARAEAILGRRITAGIGRPAPLCDVVTYLAEQADATILVDGPALAAAGMAVETEARLVAANESLEVALATLLEPLGLVYRVVDEKVIEITTLKAAATRPCIEFYPVRGLFSDPAPAADAVESHRERLLAAAGIEGSSAVIVFDPPSRCLVVSAAYPEQVRLERALRKLDRP